MPNVRTLNRRSRSRKWCFTINNYTEEQYLDLISVENLLSVRYLIVGKECARSTGTKHLQGAVVFKNARTMGGVKAVLKSHSAHLEIMGGTFKQASDYCKKELCFFEYGDLPLDPSGKAELYKARWASMIELAKNGDIDDIGEEEPQLYVSHYRTWKAIARDTQVAPAALESEFRKPTGDRNVWIYGPSGTGKTYYAMHLSDSVYPKNLNKWWDFYDHEDVVVINEVDPDNSKWMGPHLKVWAQEDAFVAEVKGASNLVRPKRIIVTSNYSIEECFEDVRMQEAIKGRFFVKYVSELMYDPNLTTPVVASSS